MNFYPYLLCLIRKILPSTTASALAVRKLQPFFTQSTTEGNQRPVATSPVDYFRVFYIKKLVGTTSYSRKTPSINTAVFQFESVFICD